MLSENVKFQVDISIRSFLESFTCKLSSTSARPMVMTVSTQLHRYDVDVVYLG